MTVLIWIHRTLDSLSDEALKEISKAYRNMVSAVLLNMLRKWLSSSKHKDAMIIKGRTDEMVLNDRFVTHRIIAR